MLYPNSNPEKITSQSNKALEDFDNVHFSNLIKKLFDMYNRYPDQRIWNIIKKTFDDYVDVVVFIKDIVSNNSTWDYTEILEHIWDKFGNKIKYLADTDELKQYFTTHKDSTEAYNIWNHNAREILTLLDIDTSLLQWDIEVSCDEWILSFVLDDHDFWLLYCAEESEKLPNWCLLKKRAKYNNKYLPIIFLRKEASDIQWTKSHEIQHHINNTLFRKNNDIAMDNYKDIIDDRFKDEIIAQAIHWTTVVGYDWEVVDRGISFYVSNIKDPDSYDFPFWTLFSLISNNYKKTNDKELDDNIIKAYIQSDNTLKNRYFQLREGLYRENFDLNDCTNLARYMIKKIPNGNLILALTPFKDRESLSKIYDYKG